MDARYQVIRKLGGGGMAEVFLANAQGANSFSRTVVLKRLDAAVARDPDAVTLFLDEARTASRLHHQHICQVFDFGHDDDGYFLAMEYLDGVDVRRLVAARPEGIEIPCVIAIGIAAAAGLHHAHEHADEAGRALGIVHRDVTAGNVFVTRDGAVKVIDFGIARAADRTTRTREGLVRGTVVYMSPEQVHGLIVDRRSDLFSLGVVLFELVTGRRPFDHPGDTDLVVMRRIEAGIHASPASLRRDCPAELDDVIERLLSVDPAMRFQTGEAVVAALDEISRKRSWSTNALELARLVRSLNPAAPPADEPATAATTPDRPAPKTVQPVPVELVRATQPIARRSSPQVRTWWIGVAAGAVVVTTVAIVAATRSSSPPSPEPRTASAEEPSSEAKQCLKEATGFLELSKSMLAANDSPYDVRNFAVIARGILATETGGWLRGVREKCRGVEHVDGYANLMTALESLESDLRDAERARRLVFAGTTEFGQLVYQDAETNKTLGEEEAKKR